MVTVEALLGALRLEPTGDDRYRATNGALGHGVVFGGQLLAQSIVAALTGNDAMTVKTLHTVFARGVAFDEPVELHVDRMQAGRSFASSTVTISQGERLCVRSSVLMSASEPDFISHADVIAPTSTPDDSTATSEGGGDWEVRVGGGVDIDDPTSVGPPALEAWSRFVGAPDDPAVNQGLLAFASEGMLIATAMRPHEGVAQSLAHRTIATSVISHTITFHQPHLASDWFLMSLESPYAGGGRSYGRGHVTSRDGRLVASFVQDNMIRAMPKQ